MATISTEPFCGLCSASIVNPDHTERRVLFAQGFLVVTGSRGGQILGCGDRGLMVQTKCRISLVQKGQYATSQPLFDLRRSTIVQMKGIDAPNKIIPGCNFAYTSEGDMWRKNLIYWTKVAKISRKVSLLICFLTSEALRWSKWKILMPCKTVCFLAIFHSCWGEIFEENLSLSWTKSAKISCKAFSYGAIPYPFLDLRSCKMEQMKGVDAMKKDMTGSNFVVPTSRRYLKKISHLVD